MLTMLLLFVLDWGDCVLAFRLQHILLMDVLDSSPQPFSTGDTWAGCVLTTTFHVLVLEIKILPGTAYITILLSSKENKVGEGVEKKIAITLIRLVPDSDFVSDFVPGATSGELFHTKITLVAAT